VCFFSTQRFIEWQRQAGGSNIPIIAVGGILRLDQAESVIEEGLADMVALGRSLIVDPELVTKTLNGKSHEIDECTNCL